MMKVIFELETARKVELLPENMPVREVLEQFHADPDAALYLANGRFLTDEDLDKGLRECGEGEEVQLMALPKPSELSLEAIQAAPGKPNSDESQALQKVRNLLCEALVIMNSLQKPSDEGLPF